jgi:hypothetical protein
MVIRSAILKVGTDSTETTYACIYDANGDTPGTLIAGSSGNSINTSVTWQRFTFVTPVTVKGGTKYVLRIGPNTDCTGSFINSNQWALSTGDIISNGQSETSATQDFLFYLEGTALTMRLAVGANTSTYPLHVTLAGQSGEVAGFTDSDGTCTINPTSTSLSCTSDVRLKKNIETMGGALQKVNNLRGVTFQWNSQTGSSTRPGFIAQEVQNVMPELVSEDSAGMLSVNYLNFAPVLVNAINELDLKVGSFTSSTTATTT